MFAGDEVKPPEPSAYGRRPQPPPGYGGYPSPSDDVYARERGTQPQGYRPAPPSSGGDGFYGQPNPLDSLTPPPPPPSLFGEAPPTELPPAYGHEDPFRPQQQGARGFPSPTEYPPQRDIYPPIPPVGGIYDRAPPSQVYPPHAYSPEPVIVEPEVVIPPEPQVFVAEESIVLILKPREFHR